MRYVGEEAKQWSNLTILITRMNPDLAMDAADQPYKKLQRALKAEIDGDAWSGL